MFKSLSRGLVLVALGTAAASAADLPRRSTPVYPDPVYAPASAYSWNGLYAGGTVGYGFGSFTETSVYSTANGINLGATLGYNYQSGNLVVGAESDLSYTNFQSKKSIASVSAKASASPLFTLRGRLGMTVDRALIYATAGYAGTDVKTQLVDTGAPALFDDSHWHHGFVLGGGIEYAITRQFSAKAEYLYATFDKHNDFSGADATHVALHQNIIRAGLNYHF